MNLNKLLKEVNEAVKQGFNNIDEYREYLKKQKKKGKK